MRRKIVVVDCGFVVGVELEGRKDMDDHDD